MLVKQEIARIKLNPGQGGYFDPITRIHLTHGDPIKAVYAGMNTTGLRAAVRSKRISIISGSLGDFTPPFRLIKDENGKVKFEWVKQGESKKPVEKPKKKEVVKAPVSTTTEEEPAAIPVWADNPQLETAPLDIQEPESLKVETDQIDTNTTVAATEQTKNAEVIVEPTETVEQQKETDHKNKNSKKKGKK